MAKCMGKRISGRDINPRPIGKIRKGGYFVPDCPDYEPRISLPTKARLDEVFTGWHCLNCKNLRIR